jgi:carbon storage regulator
LQAQDAQKHDFRENAEGPVVPMRALVSKLPVLDPWLPGEMAPYRDNSPWVHGVESWREANHGLARKEGSEMLVLSRKLGEKIYIGENICITVVDIDRGKIRLGIEAPRNVPVFRQELLPLDGSATPPTKTPALSQ